MLKLSLVLKVKIMLISKYQCGHPGSYKVREFSKAFENVRVEDLEISRRDKNTWRIETKGKEQVKLSYDVYCFKISVRHSYVDQFYAFLHGVSAFGYLDGFENEQIVH